VKAVIRWVSAARALSDEDTLESRPCFSVDACFCFRCHCLSTNFHSSLTSLTSHVDTLASFFASWVRTVWS